MRLRRPERPFEGENILPLINVVFLLLIFFLLAGQMRMLEIIAVEPPESESEAKPRAEAMQLLIGSDGNLALGDQPVSDAELHDKVSALAGKSPGMALRLKADRATDAARAIDVMMILHKAGADRVVILTEQPSDTGP